MKDTQTRRRGDWGAVLRLIGLLIIGLFVLAGCGDDAEATDPSAVIHGWADAYNAGDVDGLMRYYAKDAVVTDHPFKSRAGSPPELRTLAIADLNSSDKSGGSYVIRNLVVTGTVAVWDHTWHSAGGRICTATGNEATIEDGKIVDWVFPLATIECFETS